MPNRSGSTLADPRMSLKMLLFRMAWELLAGRRSMIKSSTPRHTPEGQRRATRYELRMGLRYAVFRSGKLTRGTGESVNLSTTGLLMKTIGAPAQGDVVVAALEWPVPAIDRQPLYLIVSGDVVRVKRPYVALSLRSHRLLRASEIGSRYEEFFAMDREARTPDLRVG